jgi:hypothetical protein
MSFLESFLSSVMNFLFGCGHDHVTRPFTLENRTYKVCLDCGHELPYSARTMTYVTARQARAQMVPVRTASILAFESPRAIHRDHSLQDSKAAA